MNGKWGHWIQVLTLFFTIVGAVWFLEGSINAVGKADADARAAIVAQLATSENTNRDARFSLAQQFQSAENTDNGKIAALEAQRASDHELWQLMLGEIKSIHEEVAALHAAIEKRK